MVRLPRIPPSARGRVSTLTRLSSWLAASLVAIGLIAAALPAGAQEQLVVEGWVVNRTPEGAGVSDLNVALHQEGTGRRSSQATVTDDEGRFLFDGIDPDPALLSGVSVLYQGAIYGVPIDLSEEPLAPIVIDVYDAVHTQDALVIDSASVLFAWADKSTRMISVLEMVQLVNDSDYTYVPGSAVMELLRFGLPEGAESLRVESTLPDNRSVQVDVGFALLSSVPPGQYEITYSYSYPYVGGESSFTRTLRNPVSQLRVLAPAEVMTLAGDGFEGPEAVDVGGRRYQLLEASDRREGDSISLSLTDLPQPSWRDGLARSLDDIRLEYTAIVSLGVLMAGLIGYSLWTRLRWRRSGP